jgi:hypothetical protein
VNTKKYNPLAKKSMDIFYASDAADTFSTKLTIFNAKLERVTLQLCFVKEIVIISEIRILPS